MVEETIVVDVYAAVVQPRMPMKAKRLVKNPLRAANGNAAGVSPYPPSAPPRMAGKSKVNSVAREVATRGPTPEFMLPRAKNRFAPTSAVAGHTAVGATSRMAQVASAPPPRRAAESTDPENDFLLGLKFQPEQYY